MDEDQQLQLFMKFLEPILNLVIGQNSFGQMLEDIIPGFSSGNISRIKFEGKRYNHLTTPFTESIQQQVADNYYKNTLSLLGYSDEAAAKHMNSDDLGNRFVNWGLKKLAKVQIGEGTSQFFDAALNRRFAYDEPSAYGYMQSFSGAANAVMKTAAERGFNSLTANEALKLGGQLIASGRYDDVDLSKDQNRVVNDIKKYAKGVRDLGDALKGGLDELFESFKKLTGNAVTSTTSGRFNNIANSLGNAIMYGNVSEQLVQQAAKTYQSANQGMSTQALSGVQAIQAETVLANRGEIENSTEQGVRAIMFNQHRTDMVSGRLRNTAAAYTHFLGGKEASEEQWQNFVKAIGGDVSDEAISSYIVDNNISSSFLNSTLVNNNMADTNIVNSGFRRRRQELDRMWANTLENDPMFKGLTADDLYLDSTDLYNKVISLGGTAEDYATIDEKRSRLFSTYIDNSADSRDIISAIKGDRRAQQIEQHAAMSDFLFDGIQGKSVKGIPGILEAMSQKWGANDAKVATIVQGFFGMATPGDAEQLMKEIQVNGTQLTPETLAKYGITQDRLDYINSLGTEERRMLIGSSYMDATEVSLDDGKGGKINRTYGDMRRELLNIGQKNYVLQQERSQLAAIRTKIATGATLNEDDITFLQGIATKENVKGVDKLIENYDPENEDSTTALLKQIGEFEDREISKEDKEIVQQSVDAMLSKGIVTKKQAKELTWRYTHGLTADDPVPDVVVNAGMKSDELSSKYTLTEDASKKLHSVVTDAAGAELDEKQTKKKKSEVSAILAEQVFGDKSQEMLDKFSKGELTGEDATKMKQIFSDVDKLFKDNHNDPILNFLSKILDKITETIEAINNGKK